VQRRSVRILRKLVVAVLFSFLFVLLGFFSGLGYHVNRIEETSFVYQYTYAQAEFSADVIYNPLVYPYYWVLGSGHVYGSFSMIYIPDAYTASGRPFYGAGPSGRYAEYLLIVISWGTLPNLLTLFVVTLAVEVVGRRVIYMVLLLGSIGFYWFVLEGVLLGVITGSLLAVLLKFWRENPLTQLWDSIWKQA